MLTENEVVDHVAKYLQDLGYKIDGTCKNTARGDDISATYTDGSRIFVECKGAVSRHGNTLDSWHNSAMAIFGAIKETEQLRPKDFHAIAVPETPDYQSCIGQLNNFFIRQKILIFWVKDDGTVASSGAPSNSFKPNPLSGPA